MKHPCTHTRICIIYTHAEQGAFWMESVWTHIAQSVLVMSQWKWSSSVVEWMCSSVKRNSTAALKNKKPITHQSPDHSMSYSLCTYVQCTYSTTWTDTNKTQHTTPGGPLHLTQTTHTHTHSSLHPLHTPTLTCNLSAFKLSSASDSWSSNHFLMSTSGSVWLSTLYTTLVWDSLTLTTSHTNTI